MKRLFDFLLSYPGLFILSPFFAIIFVLLFINNRGNIFFIQRSPSKNKRIFSIIKFKIINNYRGINGKLLPYSERMTKVGNFIRNSSIDEIHLLYIRPSITSWAQVNGGNSIGWKKIEYTV